MGLKDLFGISTAYTGQHRSGKHAAGKHTAVAKEAKSPREPKTKKGNK